MLAPESDIKLTPLSVYISLTQIMAATADRNEEITSLSLYVYSCYAGVATMTGASRSDWGASTEVTRQHCTVMIEAVMSTWKAASSEVFEASSLDGR